MSRMHLPIPYDLSGKAPGIMGIDKPAWMAWGEKIRDIRTGDYVCVDRFCRGMCDSRLIARVAGTEEVRLPAFGIYSGGNIMVEMPWGAPAPLLDAGRLRKGMAGLSDEILAELDRNGSVRGEAVYAYNYYVYVYSARDREDLEEVRRLTDEENARRRAVGRGPADNLLRRPEDRDTARQQRMEEARKAIEEIRSLSNPFEEPKGPAPASPTEFRCTGCGQKLSIGEFTGTVMVSCPKCGTKMKISKK
ncbi:MAG: hypothetical protein J5822_02220 [Eubacteriaceae bacterium]|nr:hypothetical protein [Eubacteriaceae bacterium]